MDQMPGRFPPPPEHSPPPPEHSPFGQPGVPGAGSGPGALFPLTLDRLIPVTFSVYRFRPWAFIGAALVVMGPLLLLVLIGQVLVGDDLVRAQQGEVDLAAGRSVDLSVVFPIRGLLVTFAGVVLTGIGGFIAQGAMAALVGQIVAGGRPNVMDGLRPASRRFFSLAGAALVVFLSIFAVLVIGAAVGGGLVLAGSTGGSIQPGIFVFLGLLVIVAAFAVLMFLLVRWSFAAQAQMLESASALGSLGRSWRLISGSSWRVFGYTLLFGLLVGVIALLISTVVTLFVGSGVRIDGDLVSFEPASFAISSVVDSILSIVLLPITGIGVTLLFMDVRWRRGERVALVAEPAAPAPDSDVPGP